MEWLTKGLGIYLFIGLIVVFILLWPCFKKLYCRYKEIANYLIVGVLTTIVSLLIYYVLVLTVLNPEKAIELQLANIISWIGSVLFAYFTNRHFVFKSENKNISREFTSFVGSRVLTLIIDMFIMYLFVSFLMFNDKLIKLVSQIIVIVANYILSKVFVFKTKKM